MALNNFGIVVLGNGSRLHPTLYRGAQPDAKGFQDLQALGVTEVMPLNGNNERESGWGGLVLDRPMTTGFDSAETVEEIVEDLQRSLDLGRIVYVHCTHGRDRTGDIIGAWRIMKCDWTFSEMEKERLLYGDRMILELADIQIVQVLHEIAARRGLDR